MVKTLFFKKNFYRISLLIFFFTLKNLNSVNSEEPFIIGEKPISLEADYIAYSFDNDIVIATGNVNLTAGKIRITSDSLQLDIDRRFLQAQGRVTVGYSEIVPLRSAEKSTDILNIEYPPDGLFTTSSILEISGKILPGYTLYINEKEVPVEITGRFNYPLILSAGENLISFLFVDENGNKTEIFRKVNYTTTSTSIFQGDMLKLDLSTWQGCIYRVEKKLEKIYFEGENLKSISQPISDLSYEVETPNIASAGLASTAKKIRIVFGESFEAWDVTFYTKGIKSISLPYYTSSVETTFAEIPFQLTGVNYSSQQHWSISSRIHYLSKERNNGFLNLNYISRYRIKNKTKEKWSCNLEQHFTIGNRKTGTVYLSRIGESDWNLNLSYQHFFSRTFEGSITTGYSPKQLFNSGVSFRKRYSASDVNFSISYTRSLSFPSSSSLTSSISYQTRPENLENTRIAYTSTLSLKNYKNTNPSFEDWEGEFRLNVFRSGIPIFPNFSLDLRTFYSTLLSFKGKQNTSYGFSSTTNLRLKNIYFTTNYSTSFYESSSIQNIKSKSFTRSLSSSLSFGRKIYWNCRISTNYDMKKKEFRDIYSSIDIRLNRLLRANVVSSYNFQNRKWTDVTITGIYSIFGEKSKKRLQGIWYHKRKEYFITLTSMI